MKYAKLDKEGKVVNILRFSPEDVEKVKQDLNIVEIKEDKYVTIGCVCDLKTNNFTMPEKTEQEIAMENQKTIYDEVQELKEKLEKYELSQNISIGLK